MLSPPSISDWRRFRSAMTFMPRTSSPNSPRLVPNEPAGWANWGVLALRQRNYDLASERLSRARELASKNDQIYYLLGILESHRGNATAAITDLRKAVDLNPQNLRATYQLAQEVERQGGEKSEAEFESVMQEILAAQPDNLAALLELRRIAAKRGEADTLKSVVAKISARSSVMAAGSAAAGDGGADRSQSGDLRSPRPGQLSCVMC